MEVCLASFGIIHLGGHSVRGRLLDEQQNRSVRRHHDFERVDRFGFEYSLCRRDIDRRKWHGALYLGYYQPALSRPG